MKYSFILPCRNEENSIGICIKKIRKAMKKLEEKDYEIIVSDSSKDRSPEIAKKLKAKVIKHNKIGYGNACLEGFDQAEGKYIILGDADASYDFSEIPKLLKYSKNNDLVLGKRKYIHKGAMPFLNRYIGNPFLSGVLRLFFNCKIKDAHTGFRVIKKEALQKLKLTTAGMEFASEILIKTLQKDLKIKEVPVHYYPRKGKTKLRRFSDAWRHLRFMLLYSPLYLFFIPGLIFFSGGIISMLLLYFNYLNIRGLTFSYYLMFLSSLLIILGYQLILFALFAKTYTVTNLGNKSYLVDIINRFLTIERGTLSGIIFSFTGLIIYGKIFFNWVTIGSGGLQKIKILIAASTLIIVGIQTIFSSFMLSILGIKKK